MVDQKLHSALALFFGLALVSGCADEVSVAPLGLKAGALAACSGSNTPLSELTELQVRVQDGLGTITFDERFGYSGGNVLVENVPEGPSETVTLFGYASDPSRPSHFGRARKVLIQKGADNPVTVALGSYGGFSCPQGDNEYTHRMFPSVTAIGQGRFFIAGGLTTVTLGGTTEFGTSDSSRKAFIYDSNTGEITRIASLMTTERAAHSAVLIRSSDKNRVIVFGGTQALQHNPQLSNQFAWTYDIGDAHSTVDVYEWEVGSAPTSGKFVDFGSTPPNMHRKRVFPMSAVVSTDGLVLVCGGGPWGLNEKDSEYQECDLWDALEGAFIEIQTSFVYNTMSQYRAGASMAPLQQGEITKLLVAGGATEGPVAEIYTSSSTPRDSGGTWIGHDVGQGPPHSFFQTLTPMGGNDFMMLGGVNWNSQHFDPPNANHAWKLTVHSDDSITSVAVPGLSTGRYFHAVGAPAGDRLVVLGGFTSNDLEPTSDVSHLTENGWERAPENETPFNARGGLGFALMDNDALLLVGGINAKEDLQTDELGAIEVYTPSTLLEP